MSSTRDSCPILMKFQFSRQFYEKKSLNIKFHTNRPVGAVLFHTDGQIHDEDTSRFLKFC